MQVATICKQFEFHAAHVLPHHEGQCARLHGHSYKLEVLITGFVRPMDERSDEGMVLDFEVIKDIYKKEIEPLVEHQFLNESLVGTNLPKYGPGDTRLHALTTCESVAMWILDTFSMALLVPTSEHHDERVKDLAIRLWETPTSYAEVGNTPWRG